uniref:HAT C-terminal dimerisation domain-containing protein n=1 Tax=Ciona savignyi TaxID=51511 RepID=H2YPP8_CIOSA
IGNTKHSSDKSASVSTSRRKRKYNQTFIQYGFTCITENDEQRPLCLLCNEVLANESLKPTKLKRHLDTKHDSYSNKPATFFQRILRTSEQQRRSFESEFLTQEKYTRASFEASWLIAKTKKPFNIGEDLVLPAAVKMTEIVRGKKEAENMRKIPLSNNTVSRRISAINDDQREQLILRIKEAMTGHTAGFQGRVKSASDAPITFTHCMIHQEALVAKKLSPELNKVVQDAVKIINFIKSRALNSRLFANLCDEMKSDHKLLLHCEVRWLSKGKALKRLLLLQSEVIIFLSQNKSDLVCHFHEKGWLLKLCYLSDVLEKLNQLNLSLQGENNNIFTLKSKIEAFIKKLNIWIQKAQNDSFEMFSSTYDFLASNDVETDVIKPIITSHLINLVKNFQQYFLPELDNDKLDWIQKPFIVSSQSIEHLSLNAQEEFAELSSDSKLKLNFAVQKLTTFWLGLKVEYPVLADLAIRVLLPFVSTYLCETAFSTLTSIKTKHQSIKDVETALRPALTNI